MRHTKRTAATFLFAGALALGITPAASAAAFSVDATPVAMTSAVGQLQVPIVWRKICRYDMWDQKTCKWEWVKPGTNTHPGSCCGGYGPMCPGFAVQPKEVGQA